MVMNTNWFFFFSSEKKLSSCLRQPCELMDIWNRERRGKKQNAKQSVISWQLLAGLATNSQDNFTEYQQHQIFCSLQFSSVAQLCPTLCDPMDCSTPGFPVHHQLPELIQTNVHRSVMPSNHLILCHPLLLPPSIFPRIRVFSNESVLHIRWPEYWSFSFSISLSSEYSGLISFRMDWLDLFAVQGTLKSLFQHHSSKASIIPCSAFFILQLSHPYMTAGKAKALTRWNFIDKVMSLLFNMLSTLVITFLPRSKCLLISWLQSPSAVIF